MSQAPTAEGVSFLQELNDICAMAPGPEKEARRKDWARRLGEHFSKRKPAQRDWQRVAANDPE